MFWARLENQVWVKSWPGTPNQACSFRNFFLGPIPELVSASCSPHFQEIQFPGTVKNGVGSAGSTLFFEFPGNAAKTCRTKFRNGAQKKVPESAGLVGDDLAVL